MMVEESVSRKRPRLCFALPGINYAHVTSNVIPARALARALGRYYDVTFLVRSFVEPPPAGLTSMAVLDAPGFDAQVPERARTNWLGAHISDELRYLRELRAFAQRMAGQFDIVLERQWRYMGHLASSFRAAGVPAGFISEGEIYLLDPPSWTASPRKRAGYETLRFLMRRTRARGLRQADLVICETEELRDIMAARHGADVAQKLAAIPQGVDRETLYPRERAACREDLGIARDGLVLVYLGSLNDSIQSLDNLFHGLARSGRSDAALHILGKGAKRTHYETLARALGLNAVFHGYKPHEEAARYIGAADLCLAPYRQDRYRNGTLTSSSCKVPEYLACGRPVLTVPCERMVYLTGNGAYGFLAGDDPAGYAHFFGEVLSRKTLGQMEERIAAALASGEMTRSGRVLSWDDVALRFHEALQPLLNREGGALEQDRASAEPGLKAAKEHAF